MHRFRKATNIHQSRPFISACLFILFLSACQNPASSPAILPATQTPVPPNPLPSTLPPTPEPLAAVPAVIELGRPFKLVLGQEAVLPNVDLHLRFEHVLEDSRCPSHADPTKRLSLDSAAKVTETGSRLIIFGL